MQVGEECDLSRMARKKFSEKKTEGKAMKSIEQMEEKLFKREAKSLPNHVIHTSATSRELPFCVVRSTAPQSITYRYAHPL